MCGVTPQPLFLATPYFAKWSRPTGEQQEDEDAGVVLHCPGDSTQHPEQANGDNVKAETKTRQQKVEAAELPLVQSFQDEQR